MPIAIDVNRSLRYKLQTDGQPLVAPSSTGGQIVRRDSQMMFKPAKDTFQSAEVRSDYQLASHIHGGQRVEGQLSGELSCASWADFFAAALKASWVAGVNSTALTNVTAAVSGNILTLTRAAGSWLTDGFKVGDVVRQTGWSTTATANNAKNGRITSLTATVMTLADLQGATAPFAAKASGDSVTITVTGKKLQVPQTGHTRNLFYLEEWQSDIAKSFQFLGCGVSGVQIQTPASGIAQIDFSMMGIQPLASASSAFFASPTAALTTDALSSPNGKLRLNGADIGTVTSHTMSIDTGLTGLKVAGSVYSPDMIPGRVLVTGNVTAYLEDASLTDAFLARTEVQLNQYLVATTAANSPVWSVNLPRIVLNSSDPSVDSNAMLRNYTYQAILNISGGAGTSGDLSTIIIQDTEVP